MNAKEAYLKQTNGAFGPHVYQEQLFDELSKGKSVVAIMPTGSGKTEGVLFPFLSARRETMASNMVVGLPLRTLVNSIGERFKEYSKQNDLNAYVMHGQTPENPLFEPGITATTIDQLFTGFSGMPLSANENQGNYVAGNLMSSFIVIDESHMLGETDGLQALLRLVTFCKSVGIQVCVMSATVPGTLSEFLVNEMGYSLVYAEDENKIPTRSKRQVALKYESEKSISIDDIVESYYSCSGNIIVIMNNIVRAKEMYAALRFYFSAEEIILIHSEFKENDRAEKEKLIQKYFGKAGEKEESHKILISTQVIEAGMDISCDKMLTDLAPIDSIIQRAGRIARWGGYGELVVFNKKAAAPYCTELVSKTHDELCNFGESFLLTWERELFLVDRVFNKYIKTFIENKNYIAANSLQALLGFVKKDKGESQKAIRTINSCQIAIHRHPERLGRKAAHLERVGISAGKLTNYHFEYGFVGKRLVYDPGAPNGFYLVDIRPDRGFGKGEFYILVPYGVGYTKEMGLNFYLGDTRSQDFGVNDNVGKEKFAYKYGRETFAQHFIRTYNCLEAELAARKREIGQLARELKVPMGKMSTILAFTLAFHDLGKMTERFQDYAYAKDGEFLAHFGKNKALDFPLQHPQIGARAIDKVLKRLRLPRPMYYGIVNAICDHHKIDFDSYRRRTGKYVQMYRFKDGWEQEVLECYSLLPAKTKKQMRRYGIKGKELCNLIIGEQGRVIFTDRISPFDGAIYYYCYALFSSILIESDRRASSEVSKKTKIVYQHEMDEEVANL